MRGFAISCLIPIRVALADSCFELLLAMIDNCTLPNQRTVNSGHGEGMRALQGWWIADRREYIGEQRSHGIMRRLLEGPPDGKTNNRGRGLLG